MVETFLGQDLLAHMVLLRGKLDNSIAQSRVLETKLIIVNNDLLSALINESPVIWITLNSHDIGLVQESRASLLLESHLFSSRD